eukprot:3760227-Rhodomonas_salina.1
MSNISVHMSQVRCRKSTHMSQFRGEKHSGSAVIQVVMTPDDFVSRSSVLSIRFRQEQIHLPLTRADSGSSPTPPACQRHFPKSNACLQF